jgi:PPOX class probable F420-dependent enzyme
MSGLWFITQAGEADSVTRPNPREGAKEESAMNAPMRTNPLPQMGNRYVSAITSLAGILASAAGIWALTAPASFAAFVDFPYSRHFIHDAGAFQLAIGTMLLLALRWRDALTVALGAFFVGNTVHAVNHLRDLDVGGHRSDWLLLGAESLLIGLALAIRLRQRRQASAGVRTPVPALEPFVDQKTVLLTTYRRNSIPVGTPVSIAVDGHHAFVRTFAAAGKLKRIRQNPEVTIAPSTLRGTPTGPAIRARARALDGDEAAAAAQSLADKYPILHGVLVPLGHRLRGDRTVHLALTPIID